MPNINTVIHTGMFIAVSVIFIEMFKGWDWGRVTDTKKLEMLVWKNVSQSAKTCDMFLQLNSGKQSKKKKNWGLVIFAAYNIQVDISTLNNHKHISPKQHESCYWFFIYFYYLAMYKDHFGARRQFNKCCSQTVSLSKKCLNPY